MILDKLLEKKDVEAYLELRRDFLKSELSSVILKIKPEDRELIKERFKGRISELNMLIDTIRSGDLKDMSKRYYREIHKTDDEESEEERTDNGRE